MYHEWSLVVTTSNDKKILEILRSVTSYKVNKVRSFLHFMDSYSLLSGEKREYINEEDS